MPQLNLQILLIGADVQCWQEHLWFNIFPAVKDFLVSYCFFLCCFHCSGWMYQLCTSVEVLDMVLKKFSDMEQNGGVIV
jgi:hypothetical protein